MRTRFARCGLLLAAAALLPAAAGSAAPDALQRLMRSLMPPNVVHALAFEKYQSFYVREEAIALSNQAIALAEVLDEENFTATVVPGTAWTDAAAGDVIIIGVSALFNIENASLVDGGVVSLGNDIPISSIQGQSNIPGRWIGGGYAATGYGLRVNPRRGLRDPAPDARAWRPWRRRSSPAGAVAPQQLVLVDLPPPSRATRRKLTPTEAAALATDGFFADLIGILPPAMQTNVTDFLASHVNFTLAAPQLPLSLLTSYAVALLDIQFTVRLLAISNTRSASARIGPTLRIGSDGTLAEGFLVVPVLSAFLAQTAQQQAAMIGDTLALAARAVAGDPAAVATQGAANTAELLAEYFGTVLGPLPLTATLAFEVILRSQLSVNDADIAGVV